MASTKVGDPSVEGVRMGALATMTQVDRVREQVALLNKSQEMVYGDMDNVETIGADSKKGAFFSPILFRNNDPYKNTDCHNIEAFGPVSTIMPYKDMENAIEIAEMGKGSLVSSIVTPNDEEATEFVLGAAHMHGRILVLNEACAKESTGHGSPMPLLTHGELQVAPEVVKKWRKAWSFALHAANGNSRTSNNDFENHPAVPSRSSNSRSESTCLQTTLWKNWKLVLPSLRQSIP